MINKYLVQFAPMLMTCLVCLSQSLEAAVESANEGKTVTLSNGIVSLKIDMEKQNLSIAEQSSGLVVLDNAWMAANGWGKEKIGSSDGRINWTATRQVESVDDTNGKGKRAIVTLTRTNQAQHPGSPTYLFSYTLYENNGVVFMGFGMRNQTAIGLRLAIAEPMIGAELLPGKAIEKLITLNGTAGADMPQVKPGARTSPNSLMLTCLAQGGRRSIVWGGLRNKEFGKYTGISRDNKIEFRAEDPLGRLVDPGQTYWSEDTFYLDVTTADPFLALEKYGRAMRLANSAKPNVYDFPVLCGWGVMGLSHLPGINNAVKLMGEMDAAQKAGVTKYTKVGIRLEPDAYFGNTEQGWWDDAHWAKFGHLIPPYETFAKWCSAIRERNGVPYTYFQVGLPSDDYAVAFPGHMLFNDISKLSIAHTPAEVLETYDYTDPGFQKHVLEVYNRLRRDGMGGIKFDYPESSWRPEGGFENRYATTAFAYREAFRLAREGLGPDVCIDERNLGGNGRPCLDLTAGIVDTQRNWGDSNEFLPGMVTISGLRWYKNRTVFNYYPDSKVVHGCSSEIRRSMLTMIYLTSGRIDLVTPFSLFTPEIVHDFTRIYPAYREPFTARPLDAFTGVKDPRVYDLELDPDWHQVALYNSSGKSDIVRVPLSGDRVTSGAIGLDPAAVYYVYDFWADALVGKIPGTGVIEKTLEPSHCAMLSVRKVKESPQVLSTSRHVLQGWVDLADVKWDEAGKKLGGVARVVGGEPFRIVLAGNGRKPMKVVAAGGQARLEAHPAGAGYVRVILECQENKDISWNVEFE
ncbi:MAG: hypothetical protein WCJ02_13435 [bacterium]